MTAFRVTLASMFIAVAAYTAVVVGNHGWSLFEVASTSVVELGWPGQFNLDFYCYLALSGFWIAWRHRYSAAGIAFGLVAAVGGILFLSVYLLVASLQTRGDPARLLLGERATR